MSHAEAGALLGTVLVGCSKPRTVPTFPFHPPAGGNLPLEAVASSVDDYEELVVQPTTLRPAARPSTYALAVLVAGLALASMGRAYSFVATPNASQIRYNFGGNGELQIALPGFNQGVHVMATCETIGFRGIAYAEVMRVTDPEPFLMWTGQNSPATGGGGGTNTSGFFSIDEGLIADVSGDGTVELESQNASTLVISNESGGARAGYVTMIW